MSILFRKKIQMIVADIGGVITKDKSLIHDSLEKALLSLDYRVDSKQKEGWDGFGKDFILYNHIKNFHHPYTDITAVVHEAKKRTREEIEQNYFNGSVNILPNLPHIFSRLRFNGIKICLTTEYNKNLCENIIENFGLKDSVDSYISAEDFVMGKPYPYMTHYLMQKHNIRSVENVAKIGDSIMDAIEGRNSGAGLVVGVLSGTGTRSDLSYRCDIIVDDITEVAKI